ncbi:ferredoxin [Methanothermobacter thermautotrophicus]|uniref:ferredoxin n=1 Tax=Methanothermobacter thermautotrophicus TaxID=145262 RepID=UPI003D7F2094
MYRLELDRTMCISCGNCIDSCPDLFEFADDGMSSIKGIEISDIQLMELEDPSCSEKAAGNCPVMCIKLYRDGEEVL